MENKTEIMQHIFKKHQISLWPKYIKLIFRGVLSVFAYANAGHLEVNGGM
jgi:hypothetical protein